MNRRRTGITTLAIGLVAVIGACASKPMTTEQRLVQWSDQTSVQAKAVIKDPARLAEAERVTDELHANVVAFHDSIEVAQDEFFEINCDYDATRDQFDEVLHRLRDRRRENTEKLIGLAMEMRTTMTAEEWTDFTTRMTPYQFETEEN